MNDTMSDGPVSRMSPQRLPAIKTAIEAEKRDSSLVSAVSTSRPATTPASSTRSPRHQRLVVADPVAFKYLEKDPTTTVLGRHHPITGYQAYVVEQWACTRTHPTFVIVSYTGNHTHKIYVGVISVPLDESQWSPKLRVYFRALAQYHGKRMDTSLGSILVTNLSNFPSSLTLIPVVSGDVRTCREHFFVNENLKRMGCSGRVGMTLAKPSPSAEAKFHQLYRTSENIPLYGSVIELVKLCQVSLVIFGKLGAEYADGLLCDVTEAAIANWWVDIGNELYNIEPTDGALGPSSVSAILGTLTGARNRLHAYGAPIGKDVFDLEVTKRAIAYFQKTQKLAKTRRLDRNTLNRLHRATAKQASGEGWTVPRAVKSTVAELSGKGGEMVMDIVGSKDKALISEIETTDIDRFVQLVKGERAKWLWHGKSKKRHTRDLFSDDSGQLSRRDAPEPESAISPLYEDGDRFESSTHRPIHPGRILTERVDSESLRKQTVLNRAKGRFKGAVGRHRGFKSEDADLVQYLNHNGSYDSSDSQDDLEKIDSSPDSRRPSIQLEKDMPGESRRTTRIPEFASNITDTPVESQSAVNALKPSGQRSQLEPPPNQLQHEITRVVSGQRKAAERVAKATNISGGFPKEHRPAQHIGILLRRSASFSKYEEDSTVVRNEYWWPRNLSFSAAENVVMGEYDLTALSNGKASSDGYATDDDRSDVEDTHPSNSPPNPKQAMINELLMASDARRLRYALASIGARVAYPMQEGLSSIQHLYELASEDVEQLNEMFYLRANDISRLEQDQRDVVEGQRSELQGYFKDVETMAAKLEYELSALKSKVEDVEDAVAEFEKQVVETERRVADIVRDRSHESWQAWFKSFLPAAAHKQAGSNPWQKARNGLAAEPEKLHANGNAKSRPPANG